MKHFIFDEQWDAIKGQLKQRYGQLADDDLTFVEGKGEEMLARVRMKLGMSEEDLESVLEELHMPIVNRMEQMKTKAAEFAGEMRSRAGGLGEEIKARAATMGEETRVHAAAAYGQARAQARTWWNDGEQYVRENPRESLLAALCAGFVAGLLIRR